MAELERSVDVDAPAEAVWAAVTDWERQSDWMLATTARVTRARGQGVGGAIEAVTALGPLRVVDSMEITAWQPPELCVVRHTGRVVRGAAAFRVIPLTASRSRFVWCEWLDLPLGMVGQLGWLGVRPVVGAGVGYSLRRLARSIGSDAVRVGTFGP